jgi:hypothetical protein
MALSFKNASQYHQPLVFKIKLASCMNAEPQLDNMGFVDWINDCHSASSTPLLLFLTPRGARAD